MTKRWLCLTLNPPRIPQIYTLTNTLKPTPVGRPIITGYEGPTERISSFVDSLLQPIAKSQKSYLKDTTDFTNFIEKTKNQDRRKCYSSLYGCNYSLYTSIPQEEGITITCQAYKTFYRNEPPVPSQYLADILRRILKENSKKLPPSTRYGYGSKNGSFICKHRYVCNRGRNYLQKSA